MRIWSGRGRAMPVGRGLGEIVPCSVTRTPFPSGSWSRPMAGVHVDGSMGTEPTLPGWTGGWSQNKIGGCSGHASG
jgi:hypothetical protein